MIPEDSQALKILRNCQYRNLKGYMADGKLNSVLVVGRDLLPETALDLIYSRTAQTTEETEGKKNAPKKSASS